MVLYPRAPETPFSRALKPESLHVWGLRVFLLLWDSYLCFSVYGTMILRGVGDLVDTYKEGPKKVL